MKNDYTVSDDGQTVTIWLNHKGKRLSCLIDAEDLPKVDAITNTWVASWSLHTQSFYVQCNTTVDRKQTAFYLHRFITDAAQGLYVDHLNHNTLDNRRCNLQVTTSSGNMMNRRGVTRVSKTGHRGIFTQCGKFYLRITIGGKREHVGTFLTIEEAIAVRDTFPGYGKKQLRHSEVSA